VSTDAGLITPRDFLSALLPEVRSGSLLEIRVKSHSGRIQQFFLASLDELDLMLPALIDQGDIWYGVGPRVRERGRTEDVRCLGATWVDMDFKVFQDEQEALVTLSRFSAKPSIVVHSGGGFHPYWLLDEGIPAGQLNEVVRVNKGLSVGLGPAGTPLDPATDAARVLRLPGTRNFKYTPPRDARVIHWEPERRYKLSDLKAAVPMEPHQAHQASAVEGFLVEGSRNIQLASLAGSMRRRGMTEAEIEGALQIVNANRCSPPLPADDVGRIAKSISRYAPAALPTALERRATARARAFQC